MAAATLSHRYITDRFLPDKAIDLMDEAASRLRMEVDSKPEELDALDREILQKQIEAEALKKEDDKASKDRLEKLERSWSSLQERSSEMTAQWQAERDKLAGARDIKEQLDRARADLESPSAKAIWPRRASCPTASFPSLKSSWRGRRREDDVMVEEAVRPNRSPRWSSAGPVFRRRKMLEGERDKLLRMEDELASA